MAGTYRHGSARDKYFHDLEYGEWYDRVRAHDNYYGRLADEFSAGDECGRRTSPAPGSYEEHMAGLRSWTYGLDPRRTWRYGPRPLEEDLYRKNPGYGHWWAEEDGGRYDCDRDSRYRDRHGKYEYVYPSRRHQKYEIIDPENYRRDTCDTLRGYDCVLPGRYVVAGRTQSSRIPRFHGKEFQIQRGWKDWPRVLYIGGHCERRGSRAKIRWKDWPKVIIA